MTTPPKFANQHAELEGDLIVEQHLARAAALAATHPLNEAPCRLARRIVRDALCVHLTHNARAEDDADYVGAVPDRLDVSLQSRAEGHVIVEAQTDQSLALVFQSLLDIHLRLGLEWLTAGGDRMALQRTASLTLPYAVPIAGQPSLNRLLASNLVLGRHAIALDRGLAHTASRIERALRKTWDALDREGRLDITLCLADLADLAGRAASDPANHQPGGVFQFLQST